MRMRVPSTRRMRMVSQVRVDLFRSWDLGSAVLVERSVSAPPLGEGVGDGDGGGGEGDGGGGGDGA